MENMKKPTNEWLRQYLTNKSVEFTDERYAVKTIEYMEILTEKPPDLQSRKQTLLSNLPFHMQVEFSDTALMYQLLIDYIEYLLNLEETDNG